MARRYIMSRHSIKPKDDDVESDQYKGISYKGVELARSSAKNIIEDIERSPNGAVYFLSGVTDEVRTKSTMEVYGHEIKRLLKGKDGYVVITGEDFKRSETYTDIAKQIKKVIDDNPNRKIIVDIPMFVKELSPREKEGDPRWFNSQGKLTPYATKLLERNGNNDIESFRDWLVHDGEDIDGLKGPKPKDVAKRYEKGIKRIEEFAKQYVGDRPFVTGIVGHSFDLDTYLTYLAGEGKTDVSTFDEISNGNGIIKETEMATVTSDHDITTLTYRNKAHRRKNLENLARAAAVVSLLLSFAFFSQITGNVIGISRNNNFYGLIFIVISLACAGVWIKLRKRK